jgi:phage-related protein
MNNRRLYIKHALALSTLAALFWISTPASAQALPPQDNDTTRTQLATFDQFMDSHPEIAEQLRRNPSLVRNEEFVENHPALQQFLQQHPGVREEITENPNGFMQQERRFDRREDAQDRDRDTTRGELANFGQFLGNHSNIAQQLSKNPSLANNEEFMENHPELQQYLQAHPGVREELKENPQAFMASVQQLNNTKPATKTPSLDPKPKR